MDVYPTLFVLDVQRLKTLFPHFAQIALVENTLKLINAYV
jgi:hypothetical protein